MVYNGCTSQIAPAKELYLKSDICQNFYTEFKDNLQKTDAASYVKIYDHSNAKPVKVCHNPYVFTSDHEVSKNKSWCVTATSYENITQMKELQDVSDIGVCPGRIKLYRLYILYCLYIVVI